MGQPCKVCASADLPAINAALVGGASARELATRYGLGKSSVARHEANHLPLAMLKARDAQEVADADDLLSQVRELQARTLAILDTAEQAGKLALALAAVREVRENLTLLGKLMGELQQEGTINIVINPVWIDLRANIVAALLPYPEARGAVVQALQEAERAGAA